MASWKKAGLGRANVTSAKTPMPWTAEKFPYGCPWRVMDNQRVKCSTDASESMPRGKSHNNSTGARRSKKGKKKNLTCRNLFAVRVVVANVGVGGLTRSTEADHARSANDRAPREEGAHAGRRWIWNPVVHGVLTKPND